MALFLLQNRSLFKNNSLQNSLFSIGLDYEYKELEKGITFFSEIFDPILNLEKNDKIGIQESNQNNNSKYIDLDKINFKLYLDKYKVYQSLARWYYKQNRKDIFSKLQILFDSYYVVVNKVKLMNTNFKVKFSKLYEDIVTLNKNLVIKLNLLNETYNDLEITPFIDSICKKLNDLNEDKPNSLMPYKTNEDDVNSLGDSISSTSSENKNEESTKD